MIYPRYATYEIYSNADGLTDKQFIVSVYIDEVATLIREEPQKVVRILRRSNVPVSPNPTRREIINKLIDNVYINKCLREELSLLLAQENSKNSKLSIKPKIQKDSKLVRTLNGTTSNSNGNLSGKVNVGQQLGNTAGNVGEGVAGGAQAGGPIGAIIGAVVGLTESVFDWKASKNVAEAEANKYKLEIFNKVSEGQKRNYTPLIIIGSVLLLGTIVLIFALRSK